MTETLSTLSLDEELHALAQPLHDRLGQVEADLKQAEQVVSQLRANRARIKSALRAVDPTFEPHDGRRKRAPRSPGEESIQRLVDLLREHREEFGDGDGFTAAHVVRQPDWDRSPSQTAKMLSVLHDRGVIRLDHTGRGGSKWFVLV